jgi:hypothetical protein
MPYALPVSIRNVAMTVVMRRSKGNKDGTFGIRNAESGIVKVVFEG